MRGDRRLLTVCLVLMLACLATIGFVTGRQVTLVETIDVCADELAAKVHSIGVWKERACSHDPTYRGCELFVIQPHGGSD